ncbi:PREDICTED: structural maintenance of chromosomes protein 2-like [Priapulus caudatus]|uniref:Structural maintenance of chromosomes protein n=1 Tax=Priapulus caudatus TaxID=37621 RepID=A0ABM1ETK6_PRICU|nr:PREDICTED: structural maintenance of chromosomes protein 2-like [Priapulus caudatus]
MYIKSMVIDGFKSYAQRTEITGFDSMFNAITGLNGSGKSNILDAICFLLGITNLQQVRASSLQELVYKGGQSGVTKASVTVTFDNSDRSQSPVGYELCAEITVTRQVVIGGRNKYLVNGSNANNNRVQDLFRSVQLNVNNPHFLIMQGRITKVLNMKPPEILSMIEEAAGTRMYEAKKAGAHKIIEKKDAKLKEIDTILTEEITPTLMKLKEERSAYLEYQKVMRELEHLTKLVVAYQFYQAEEQRHGSAEKLNELTVMITQFEQRKCEIDAHLEKLEELVAELTEKRDAESGGVIAELEKRLHDKRQHEAKQQSSIDSKKESLKTEQKKRKDLLKQQTEDTSSKQAKMKEMDKLMDGYNKVKQQSEADQAAHAAAQKLYRDVSAGLSSNDDGDAATIAEQLITAQQAVSQAETDTKQATMKLKHAKDEIKKKGANLKETERVYKKEQANHEAVQAELKKLQAQMDKLDYSTESEEELTAKRRTLAKEVNDLWETVENAESSMPQLRFEYTDPEKNFDRRKVAGLVAKLVRVKDVTTATALEVVAGGKLYNVIVDTEQTGKKLLEHGKLKRRYTIIPLNKIQAYPISDNVVKTAKSLVGKDNVHTALSLVGYEDDLHAAMEFVFGSTFICASMEAAKSVTFHEKIKKRSVTLAGETYDPQGTLSGGARPQDSSVLQRLQKVIEAENLLKQKRAELNQIDANLQKMNKVSKQYGQLKQQYDLKVLEANVMLSNLQQSRHQQQLTELEALKESIGEQEEVLEQAKQVHKKATQKAKELANKISDAKNIRERELKSTEKKVADEKKKMEASSKQMREKQQEMDTVKLEIEELQASLDTYANQLTATDEAISAINEQLKTLDEALALVKADIAQIQGKLAEVRKVLMKRNKEIAEQQTQQEALRKERHTTELRVTELQHDVKKQEKSSKDMEAKVQQMFESYDWILEERKYFGQADTAYNFEKNNPKEASKKLQKLQETKERLGKTVNMRAMTMLGKAEEQYQDLMKKKKIVENDKLKIAATIAELDEKKNEVLMKAHKQVNKDFSSIFSTLLPGSCAKLAPPEGQSVLDGLEVKVAFGDVWKESLSELSGGQRSLVALSLILSLLLFKPAPLYILDEVDAALDLSHTQNIGQMLQTHFRHSQFIVVSLKDGMFANANVLFKTKFVDGVSTVTRYSQQQNQSRGSAQQRSAASSSRPTKKVRKTHDENHPHPLAESTNTQ